MNKQNKQKLLQPQEIEVFYIIPAIRKHLAMQMKSSGLKQKRIAELLQIEEGTVSQYLSNKRGNQVSFNEKVIKEVENSAKLIKDQTTLLGETQRLLSLIRQSGDLCKFHKKFSNIPKTCGFEVVKCGADEDHAHSNVTFIKKI